ncbi:FtsQ-type POTRA domain-containing protein [Streptomyces sp. NPDC049577]|uniref:cell division protein FtsQ/DivIB n=1 Tax=Streptomyces sp. NPDC049577 TaxID=3155153 RepID=UPI00341F521E
MAGPTTARRGGGQSDKPKPSRQGGASPGRSRPASGARTGQDRATPRGAARGTAGGGPGKPPRSAPKRPVKRPAKGAGKAVGKVRGKGAAPARSPLSRRRRLVLWAAAAAAAGAAAWWTFYGSDWLCVTRVSVSGTVVLTPGEVRSAADVPLGEPLAGVDTDAIAGRLRERLPRIESVAVERSWPHAISLKVTERQPKLLLQKGGKYLEIDSEGVRFATVGQPPPGVPRLVMETQDSPSTRRFGPGRLEQEGARVAASLPPAVRKDTAVVRVRSYDGISVELTGGRTIVWGSGERGEEKARTLTALLKAAPTAKHFDVSAPSAPAASGG